MRGGQNNKKRKAPAPAGHRKHISKDKPYYTPPNNYSVSAFA